MSRTAPGTRIGPYEIVAALGKGGMGEVWRARDPRLSRDVAIKALSSDFAADPERLARFEREARLLASLSHPNIAAIYGLEEAEGVPHLVLELVEGETLAGRLARGPLELKAALAIAIQVAAAVEAAHERGIVHRDLKPGNVMIEPSGAVKVLDFGLARGPDETEGSADRPTLAGVTTPGVVLGTAAYMSPEQARGTSLDRRTDVWSFGCLVFECLAGRPPFEGATASDLIARILVREPDWKALPAGIPPRLRDVLQRCLRKEADERPRDIRDVRLELVAVASPRADGGSAAEKSIVVLPFTHPVGADEEYFADGITEEILNALAKVEGLRVAARTSSFAFKGRSEDLRRIAEALDVATVLEGSVRRAGNRLRITARLVNAADGYQLWSERYDRELTDVFALQDEIAGAIAERLALSFGAEGRQPAAGTNLEAYELFLKGRTVIYRRGRYVFEGIAYLERAIALQPDYAEALGLLADGYRSLATFGMSPPHEVMPKAREFALRALELDPHQAEALTTLGDIQAQYDHDWSGAMGTWAHALETDPKFVRARCERALWAIGFGGMSRDEAEAEIRIAVEADPLNAWAIGMWSTVHDLSDDLPASLAMARRAVDADPNNYFAQYNLLRSLAFSPVPEDAIVLAQAHLRMTGRQIWSLVALAAAYAQAGRREIAVALSDELEARARSEYVSPAWRAFASASAGLVPRALEQLRLAFEERDPFVVHVAIIRYLAPLHGHPEFEAMVEALGRWPAA